MASNLATGSWYGFGDGEERSDIIRGALISDFRIISPVQYHVGGVFTFTAI